MYMSMARLPIKTYFSVRCIITIINHSCHEILIYSTLFNILSYVISLPVVTRLPIFTTTPPLSLSPFLSPSSVRCIITIVNHSFHQILIFSTLFHILSYVFPSLS